jgi:hypothetical protein
MALLRPQVVLALVPPMVLITTLAAFPWRAGSSKPLGYFIGSAFCWVVWGFLLPLGLLGLEGWKGLFCPSRLSAAGSSSAGMLCLLATPTVLAYGFEFPRVLPQASPAAVVASAGLAAINGSLEEGLWRGPICARPRGLGCWARFTLMSGLPPNTWFRRPFVRIPGPGAWAFVAIAGALVFCGSGWRAEPARFVGWCARTCFSTSRLGGRIYFAQWRPRAGRVVGSKRPRCWPLPWPKAPSAACHRAYFQETQTQRRGG